MSLSGVRATLTGLRPVDEETRMTDVNMRDTRHFQSFSSVGSPSHSDTSEQRELEDKMLQESAQRLSKRVSTRHGGGILQNLHSAEMEELRAQLSHQINNELKTQIHAFAVDGFAQDFFAEQKKAGLFSRTAKTEELVTFSLRPLTSPITHMPESAGEDAVKLIKNIMIYMGDANGQNGKESAGDVHLRNVIVDFMLTKPFMMAEGYCQLVKQTNGNPDPASEVRGFELLALLCCKCSPPEKELRLYVLNHVDKFRLSATPSGAMALFVYSKVIAHEAGWAAAAAAAAATDDEISAEEIELMKESWLPPDLYSGCNLEQLLLFEQYALSPDLPPAPGLQSRSASCPIVIAGLCQAINDLGGATQEGIFRLAAEADALRLHRVAVGRMDLSAFEMDAAGVKAAAESELSRNSVDSPKTPAMMVSMTPLIPADLLKQLLRSMKEPIIPYSVYDRCLAIGRKGDSAAEAAALMGELRPANRATLYTVISFLAELSKAHDVTQMGVDNLALVLAPNLLKNPSDDPLLFAANSGDERGFVGQLIHAQLEGLLTMETS